MPEERINHRNMLERLIREIVHEESVREQERVNATMTEAALKAQEAKRIRDQRKLEAMERSRLRQLDPNYFQTKASANVEAKTVNPEIAPSSDDAAEIVEDVSCQEEVDPFRLQKTSRNKLFVR